MSLPDTAGSLMEGRFTDTVTITPAGAVDAFGTTTAGTAYSLACRFDMEAKSTVTSQGVVVIQRALLYLPPMEQMNWPPLNAVYAHNGMNYRAADIACACNDYGQPDHLEVRLI